MSVDRYPTTRKNLPERENSVCKGVKEPREVVVEEVDATSGNTSNAGPGSLSFLSQALGMGAGWGAEETWKKAEEGVL